MSVLAGMFGKIILWLFTAEAVSLCFSNWKWETCCTTYITIQKSLNIQKALLMNELHTKNYAQILFSKEFEHIHQKN